MATKYRLSAVDGIALAIEQLEDLQTLLDDILINFFEKYDTDSEKDRISLCIDYTNYGSFMRIASKFYYTIIETLKETDAKKT